MISFFNLVTSNADLIVNTAVPLCLAVHPNPNCKITHALHPEPEKGRLDMIWNNPAYKWLPPKEAVELHPLEGTAAIGSFVRKWMDSLQPHCWGPRPEDPQAVMGWHITTMLRPQDAFTVFMVETSWVTPKR